MPKWNQGFFNPKHPKKYVGSTPIRWRSSWELVFMNMCDSHPSIIYWASESIKIPYINPVTRKGSFYIPDFFIVYVDKNGKKHQELVEIKPIRQTMLEFARTKSDKMFIAINTAKWNAARRWARNNKSFFRILTERDLFRGTAYSKNNYKRKRSKR